MIKYPCGMGGECVAEGHQNQQWYAYDSAIVPKRKAPGTVSSATVSSAAEFIAPVQRARSNTIVA